MDAEIKYQWTAALRSGDYAQDEGFLRTRNGWCCLGVLCNLHKPNEWELALDKYHYRLDDTDKVLPPDTIEWAGLSSHNPIVTLPCPEHSPTSCETCNNTGNIHISLAELNDAGRTFDYIAGIIEEQL